MLTQADRMVRTLAPAWQHGTGFAACRLSHVPRHPTLVGGAEFGERQVEQAIDGQMFTAGLTHQNMVLQAEGKVLEQQRIAIDLTARALDTQVLLVRAVGGTYPIQAAPIAN